MAGRVQHFENVRIEGEPKVTFGQNYIVCFVPRILNLLRSLKPSEQSVLFTMIEVCAFGNTCRITRQNISERTDINENHVSSIIQVLIQRQIINKTRRDEYNINAEYIWKGSAKDYHRARRRDE